MVLTLNSTENRLSWSKHAIGHDKTDAEASKQSKSDPSSFVPFKYVPDGSVTRTDIGTQVTLNLYQVLFVWVYCCADFALCVSSVSVPPLMIWDCHT